MTDQIDRRTVLSLLAGATLSPGLTGMARAAGYPERAIHVAVPFSAGGAVDIVARTVMQQAGPQLGQPIVIENRPGASGNIATAFVAKSDPDGYNVLIAANNLATNEALFDSLPFNAEKDLEPVALVGYSPLILVVQPQFEAKTVKDIVDMAKASPDKLTFASAGTGTSGHLAAEIFKQVTGIQALHVPYKGGAQAMVDIIAGRVSFMFVDPVQGMPQIRANQLRPVAVSSRERLVLLPDVPTVTEAGFPGVEATVWWGFLVPARTPKEIVTRLNKEIDLALGDQKVKDSLREMGAVVKGGTPEDFRAFIKSETERWGNIIRTAKIKAE
ncbi:tripartite tricarboxylate transporter substrate binding protein [Bradyrhizobium sp. BRP22]|uniref:Bug family tripartite tricarboxylate transporter substrate binding protein n=1 Tax=Bradyrhizobium sp. BRP22 TaxID=2793821 RepID=UPI001CD50577|nr:tripartite tricarboxylate transporter substrate binding protein [Bradyrhizobium sp. BRP22]